MMAPAGGGRPAALAQRGSDMTELGDHTLSPRELEERFDLLVADAREYAVFIVDPGGKLLCWNPGAERLFGYRTYEVMGQHFSRLLSPALNALDVLRQMRTDDPIIRQAAGIIERQVGQMVRLVDDLLDVGRMTSGKLRLCTERVELRVAMNRAAESARPLLDARRHEFSLQLPTEPLWVEADPARLEQAAAN